jgi:hypothetical protein
MREFWIRKRSILKQFTVKFGIAGEVESHSGRNRVLEWCLVCARRAVGGIQWKDGQDGPILNRSSIDRTGRKNDQFPWSQQLS